jgi:hypothetical protein
MPSLGAASLGSSTAAGVGSSIGASVANAVAGASGNADSSASGSGSGSDNGSSANGWIITLTGFRGNSLGVAVGESPDWNNSTGFAANANAGITPVPATPGVTGSNP